MTGADLRAWRIRLGMTQPELAAALSVGRNTVTRWERSLAPIGNPGMLRLALERLEQRRTHVTGTRQEH